MSIISNIIKQSLLFQIRYKNVLIQSQAYKFSSNVLYEATQLKIKNKVNQELKLKDDILECRLCFCTIFLG